ncbi:TetR/AcrR family transcriptional regulator [Kribbella jejuensis]|uniref:TetR family transcriptional regulator n=1 Tax=Kribbella jejuensis TaxID=236068 RepID=A0A542DTH6_9ACTN|nr:TetR/AcrR family transcriptional regulator [Kribbella jejuensis]TQJ06401.1 TetR family transcriptional regulator [Kribbella jejuensis]
MARAGLTGERLAAAGAELADELGFDQLTVSALARHFDVQVASLYSHVRNSEDLKTRIATVALTELADQAAAALAGRSGADALTAMADVYRTYAREHPGRYAAARHTPAPPTDQPPTGARRTPAQPEAGVRRARSTSALGTEYVEAGRRHSELWRAVLRGYDLGEPQQTDAVRLIGSVVHGYVTLELAGSFSYSDPPSDTSWPRILDALDHLLRTWS